PRLPLPIAISELTPTAYPTTVLHWSQPTMRNVWSPLAEELVSPGRRRLSHAPRRFVQLDVEAQVRVVTGPGFDDARQQAGAEGGEGGDAHAGPADGVEAVDEFIEFGHGGEDLTGVLGQALAELGDLDAAPGPVVQGCADALLQGGDVLTDRRRRVVEVLRGRDHR